MAGDEDTLNKLREILDRGEAAEFSAQEIRRIRAMIEAYDMFLAGGRLGKWFMGAVIMLAAAIAGAIKLAEYWASIGRAQP